MAWLPDPDRREPFNCPECGAVTVAEPLVEQLTCSSCGHVWQVREIKS